MTDDVNDKAEGNKVPPALKALARVGLRGTVRWMDAGGEWTVVAQKQKCLPDDLFVIHKRHDGTYFDLPEQSLVVIDVLEDGDLGRFAVFGFGKPDLMIRAHLREVHIDFEASVEEKRTGKTLPPSWGRKEAVLVAAENATMVASVNPFPELNDVDVRKIVVDAVQDNGGFYFSAIFDTRGLRQAAKVARLLRSRLSNVVPEDAWNDW